MVSPVFMESQRVSRTGEPSKTSSVSWCIICDIVSILIARLWAKSRSRGLTDSYFTLASISYDYYSDISVDIVSFL